MKIIRNILASAAVCFAAASCTIESNDAFSTAPVAPVMDVHSDILITEGTTSEAVTFSWSAARFINAEVYTYNLYVKNGEKEVALAQNLKETYYTSTKTAFRDFMKGNFQLEQNSTHTVSVYASIKDDEDNVYTSEAISIKVYVYDNAVAPALEASLSAIELDKNNPAGVLELLSWSDARMTYGEDVTYGVTMQIGNGVEKVLASDLYGTSWSTTVDALNEAVVAAGGVEEQESEVKLKVMAYCESIPEGIPSNTVTLKVITYVATFPEMMWIPGSHQGWNPATAPTLSASTSEKGVYQGFVDLNTADGSNVEFKFSAAPSWSGVDFGFDNIASEMKGCTIDGTATEFAHVTGNGQTSANIVCPAGFYFVKLNKKFNTIEMVEVKNLELIGDFNGWAAGVPMEWNADARTWTAPEQAIAKDSGFKIRFNSDWTYSFGGTLDKVDFGGGNISMTKTDATYKIILNASSSDLKINAVDVNMPDWLVMAGNYSGHSWSPTDDMKVYLKDSSTGIYKGYATMYNGDQGFKFVKNGNVWMGGNVIEGTAYSISETGGNMFIADGSYYWEVDILNMNATATPIATAGIIGSFAASNWGSDVLMTFDESTLSYSAEVEFAAGNEWKFRFNGNWGYNLGLSDGVLIHDGANIKVETAGTYVITLDMAHGSTPSFTCTLK